LSSALLNKHGTAHTTRHDTLVASRHVTTRTTRRVCRVVTSWRDATIGILAIYTGWPKKV